MRRIGKGAGVALGVGLGIGFGVGASFGFGFGWTVTVTLGVGLGVTVPGTPVVIPLPDTGPPARVAVIVIVRPTTIPLSESLAYPLSFVTTVVDVAKPPVAAISSVWPGVLANSFCLWFG